jgi:hypothetical protein
MMTRATLPAVLLVLAATVSGCSSGDDGPTTESPSRADSTTSTIASSAAEEPQTSTTTTTTGPAISGVDPIEQLTPQSGGGSRPLLEWLPAGNAASYFVVVYDENADPYWSTLTSEPRVYVGGIAQIPEGRDGPAVAAGYSWVVYADDIEGNLVAASGIRSIAP